MTHKLRSNMSSQKIDTSSDISFGSLTLLEGFVILDLNVSYNNQTGLSLQIVSLHVTCWHRNVKPPKYLIIDMSFCLGSTDVITS